MRLPTEIASGTTPPGLSPSRAPSPSTGSGAGPLAEINTLPRDQARRVLSPANLWIATVLTLLPIPVGLIGGIGLVGLGIAYAGVSQGFTAVCVVSGLLTGAGSVLCLLHLQKLAASHYLKAVARGSLASR